MSLAEIGVRFLGVENSPPATDEQKIAVSNIRRDVLKLAQTIETSGLHPRYKATALTELETAAMFAVKGVFQTDAFETKDPR